MTEFAVSCFEDEDDVDYDALRRGILPDGYLRQWVRIAGNRPDVIRENIKIEHQFELVHLEKRANRLLSAACVLFVVSVALCVAAALL